MLISKDSAICNHNQIPITMPSVNNVDFLGQCHMQLKLNSDNYAQRK